MDEKRKELISNLNQTRVILKQRRIRIKLDLFALFEAYCDCKITVDDFKADAEALADAYMELGYAIEGVFQAMSKIREWENG